VAADRPPPTVRSVLRDVFRWLSATRTRGALIGGVAASIRGRPRFTQDVDLLVDIDGLIAANPKLDRKRVLKIAREFAEAMSMPEVVARVQQAFDHADERLADRRNGE